MSRRVRTSDEGTAAACRRPDRIIVKATTGSLGRTGLNLVLRTEAVVALSVRLADRLSLPPGLGARAGHPCGPLPLTSRVAAPHGDGLAVGLGLPAAFTLSEGSQRVSAAHDEVGTT